MDVSQLKCRPRFEEMEQLKSHLRAGPAAQISAFISHIYVRLLSCVISVIDCRHCRRCPQLFYSNSLLSAYMSCILLVQFNYQAWHSFFSFRGRCTYWPTVWFTWTPRDQNLPAKPISTHKAQSRKKPTNLCAPREILKKKSVCHIWQSFNLVTLTIEWTKISHSLAAWSAFRALGSLGSWRTTRAKDHRLFFVLITHKSTRSENRITWQRMELWVRRNTQCTTHWQDLKDLGTNVRQAIYSSTAELRAPGAGVLENCGQRTL